MSCTYFLHRIKNDEKYINLINFKNIIKIKSKEGTLLLNINCTKYSYRTFTILLLPLLYLLSNFLPEGLFGKNREYQFIEIFQIIVLLSCLVLNFSYRTLFFKVSNFFTFFIRQLWILVLLYEELSFLTFSTNNTFNFVI